MRGAMILSRFIPSDFLKISQGGYREQFSLWGHSKFKMVPPLSWASQMLFWGKGHLKLSLLYILIAVITYILLRFLSHQILCHLAFLLTVFGNIKPFKWSVKNNFSFQLPEMLTLGPLYLSPMYFPHLFLQQSLSISFTLGGLRLWSKSEKCLIKSSSCYFSRLLSFLFICGLQVTTQHSTHSGFIILFPHFPE